MQGQIISDQYNRGYEDAGNGAGHWLIDAASGPSTNTYNSSTRRIGVNGGRVQTSSATPNIWRNTGYTIPVPDGAYAHIIAHGRRGSSTLMETVLGVRFNTTDYSTAVVPGSALSSASFTQMARSVQNTTGATVAATPFISTRSTDGTTSIEGFYDDLVFYTSNSATPDITKPSAAGCLRINTITSTSVNLQWMNGADAETGIQGSLVVRFQTSSTTQTLSTNNIDQGTYTTSSSAADGVNIMGFFSIIADLPAGQNSYTDLGLTANTTYRYAIVHYDRALNYSLVSSYANATTTVPARYFPNISQSIQNVSKKTGGIFTAGDTVQLNLIVDVSGSTLNNLKTRIYIDPKFQLVNNSMKIKDNKGFDFSDPTTPPAGSCYTYLATQGSNGLSNVSGDDRGRYDAMGNYVEIMLGELPVGPTISQLESGSLKLWGGRMRNATAPKYYGSRSIVVASIQVMIPIGTAPGEIFDFTSSTTYSFSDISDLSGLNTYEINSLQNPSRFIQLVVSDPALPTSYSSFGANLFTLFNNGTFGGGTNTEGTATLSSSDLIKIPVATNAPGDGFYSVVKNTAGVQAQTNNNIAINHSDRIHTHWYIGGDHTASANAAEGNPAVAATDSGGYMLMVNADYVPTRVVSQTLTGLCPGTYYNFKAWIKNICPSCGVNSNTGANIRNANPLDTDPRRQGGKPSLTFDVNDKAYYTTGPIDTSDKWIEKQFVFATGSSSGDFNFSIRNNAPGGDGNDWVLDDIRIITRGPIASAVVSADPFVDPSPSIFCAGQRFRVIGNWIENTGGFTQYDSYQFQYANGPTGPWSAIGTVGELSTPNDPFNPTGRLDSIYTQPFTVNNQDLYFRVVVATQPSNISLDDAAPCQITAYNSSVVRIASCTLPVKLLRFNAATFGQQVILKWATGDLNTLQKFVVERSTNGMDFAAISTVDAKAYSIAYQYQLTDNPNTTADRLWYRLKMVHQNNEITYSGIEAVGWKKQALSLSIQPNPAKDMVQLNWSGVSPNQKVSLSIRSISGQVLHTQMITIQQGPTQNLKLPNIPAGLYFLLIEDVKTQYRQTIKLNKL